MSSVFATFTIAVVMPSGTSSSRNEGAGNRSTFPVFGMIDS
jgi:hypothetical protein